MKKFINFLFLISNTINYIACILQDMNLHQEYYVYVPSNNKPTYKHRTFKAAEQEMFRLADKVSAIEDIEVLHVVKKIKGNDIPF